MNQTSFNQSNKLSLIDSARVPCVFPSSRTPLYTRYSIDNWEQSHKTSSQTAERVIAASKNLRDDTIHYMHDKELASSVFQKPTAKASKSDQILRIEISKEPKISETPKKLISYIPVSLIEKTRKSKPRLEIKAMNFSSNLVWCTTHKFMTNRNEKKIPKVNLNKDDLPYFMRRDQHKIEFFVGSSKKKSVFEKEESNPRENRLEDKKVTQDTFVALIETRLEEKELDETTKEEKLKTTEKTARNEESLLDIKKNFPMIKRRMLKDDLK